MQMRRKSPIAGQRGSEPQDVPAGMKEGAMASMHPSSELPPPPTDDIAGQHDVESQRRRAGSTEGASGALNPKQVVPPPPLNEVAGHYPTAPQVRVAGDGTVEGASVHVQPSGWLPPPPPPHIAELIEWQRRRVHAIRAQSQCDRSCDAYVSRYLGYHAGLPKAERLALMKQAAQMRAQVEKSKGHNASESQRSGAPDEAGGEGLGEGAPQVSSALTACLPIIVNTIQSRAGWDALRKDAETRMREIARNLPV